MLQALAELGPSHPKTLPFLLGLLRNEKAPLADHAGAANALGAFGPIAADAVPDIIALLRVTIKRPEPPCGRAYWVIPALARMGEAAAPAVPLLVELAGGDETSDTAGAAVTALGDLGPASAELAFPLLVKLFLMPDRQDHVHLADTLIRFGSASTPHLLRAMRTASEEQQIRVIQLLGRLGPDALGAVPDLKRLAGGPRGPLRNWAEMALAQIQP